MASVGSLVFGWDRSSVGTVEVWLRRPRAGQPDISAELIARSRRPAAAAGVVAAATSDPLQELYATRRKAGFPRSVLRYPWAVVWLRGATGEHGLRRRAWRWVVTWRSAGERSEGRGRVPRKHRPSGATAAVNSGRSRSPLNALSGWKLGLLITDFARFINSEIALSFERRGAATHEDLPVGSGGTHEEIARPLEGRFVGRALRLHAQRAALEPLDPSSGDRLVRTGAPPRADRAITRRRGRRPCAWGEPHGPRTAQSWSLGPRTRDAA
jgi:hypothetical protein